MAPIKHDVKTVVTLVSGVAPQTLIAAQSGFIYALLSIQATNRTGATAGVSFFDGATKFLPTTYLGPSGTYLNDSVGGEQYNLTRSSGLNVSLSASAGPVEVAVQYFCIDRREPLSKEQYRAATYIAPGTYNVIRTPNRLGQQSEG